jgi:anaerobic selenocysteine-containing dehydrogenase
MTVTEPGRIVHTACTLDCPDACSLAVHVVEERIVSIDASPDNPLTDGWICSKVGRQAKRVYAPERVLTPLRRTGPKGTGAFAAISWDEALADIAARIGSAVERRGPESVVAFTYNSSAAAVESTSASEALFATIGATVADHTICAATVSAAWDSVYGDMNSADPHDVVNADLIVIWGANPTVSNTHFPPLVTRAVKARGARVIVIDPRRTAMASRADLHLAIRPGTDVVLAYAVARIWAHRNMIDTEFVEQYGRDHDAFLAAADEWPVERAAEVCGLAATDIATFADWWGSTRPSMLRIGWGQERNANGGAACRAILALPILAGHFREPGSGVIGSTSVGAVKAEQRWPEIPDRPRRHVPLHQVGGWLSADAGEPFEVLFVQGANPVVMCPDQHRVIDAFARDDVFTIVHDQVLTDTARFADIVLPATTSFEIDDVATSYGTYMVQPVRAAIAPVGESRSNDAVGIALAAAMGVDLPMRPLADAIDDAGPRRVDAACRQFVDTFPVSTMHTGRVHLVDPDHGVPRFVPVDHAPGHLQLISPATSKLVNSMFGEFQSPAPTVLMHPDDAAARAITAGQTVRVSNEQGELSVVAEIADVTRRGVVVMAKGVWLREHGGGPGVNALTPATGDALVNGACFNDTFVDITPM